MWSEDSICFKCAHYKVCSKFWDLIPDFDHTVVVSLVKCDDFLKE